jgi:glycosyltransferase involved in cell wall biosynthesis
MYIYYQRKFVQVGGSEIFALNLFEEINKNNQVLILSLYLSKSCSLFISKNYESIYNKIVTPSFSLKFFLTVLNFLFSKKSKIIFNYGLAEMFLINFLFFKKIIYLAHDMFKFDEFKPINHIKKNKIKNLRLFLIGWIEKKFNKVLVLTKKAQNERYSLFNYRPIVLNAAIRNIKDFSNNKSNNYLLSIGRLEKKKNIDLLLYAFKKIIKIYPKLKLEICGDGKQMKNLKIISNKLKLSNKINFRGFVSDQKKFKLIKKSSCIFCLDKADFDIVIYESLLHSKPVVCSYTNSINKNLINLGWVVKSNLNSDDIYKNAIKVIKNISRKKTNNLKKILNEYTFEKYAKKITRIGVKI